MSEESQVPQEPVRPTPPPQNGGFNYGIQQSLPNSTAVLILGILSIVTCCCYGAIGLILAIVALILSKRDRGLYAANMSFYTESSFKNLNAGRVCAIIGLIFNILMILMMVGLVAYFGWDTVRDQEALQEALRKMQAN